jgi:uncharacterized RDD family membrane protein YckC
MKKVKYRTGLKRLGAAIVDGIVFIPLLFVDQWINKTTSSDSILFGWTTFIAFAPFIYSVVLHYKYGQTIGKWVAGVKVMDISETRKLTLFMATFGFLYFGFLLMRSDNPENVLADYLSFSDNPLLWWTLIELITMLTNSKKRAVHDFLAKSVVIRTGIR